MGHQEASLLWVICVLVNHEELQMHVFIFSTVAKWLYFCRQHFPMGLSLVQHCSNSIALAMELLQSWESILVFWLNIHVSLVPGVINNNAVLIQMLSADKQQAITWTNDDLVHWHIYVSPDRSELKQLWCIASEVVFNALNLLVLKTEYSRTWSVPWLLTHSLQWCMMHDGISNHQPHDCLLNRLFKAQIKETSKLCITGLCEGNSLVTGEFPTQRASNAENVSIWWCHHGLLASPRNQ